MNNTLDKMVQDLLQRLEAKLKDLLQLVRVQLNSTIQTNLPLNPNKSLVSIMNNLGDNLADRFDLFQNEIRTQITFVKTLLTPDQEIDTPRRKISLGTTENQKVFDVPVDCIQAFKKAGIKKRDLSNPDVANMIESVLGQMGLIGDEQKKQAN